MSELEQRLADLAAAGLTITYGQLSRDLGWRMAELTAALEALMVIDARNGHPLRASVCKGRLSGGLPARGFFDKAVELGLIPADDAAFVAKHRTALFHAAQTRQPEVVAPKSQTGKD
ncbi:MAG: hypothetical protein U0934_12815 [Pseudotabrizicola sp.]|uniref:hypothetical protein n=1 Tax=Pseudotabrizicola sp. TaxID=2939647 RepID=UPI0027235285|nr:hypothetical protein [Pseudotabrizicola sp.]MDO8882551.1 hypothetical protein [Pseudotabrizicola sp.]MDP2079819.1 hypothetical protein [Pseudotabrizicola sp.]MDZ7574820.1 hypothetical protein [Pseudotabrizicola sp.]